MRGFAAAYDWNEAPKDWTTRDPSNPYEIYSDQNEAWQRGYLMGRTLAAVETQDVADKEAMAMRSARSIVNETDPQLVLRF